MLGGGGLRRRERGDRGRDEDKDEGWDRDGMGQASDSRSKVQGSHSCSN